MEINSINCFKVFCLILQGGLQAYIAHYDSSLINWPGLAIDFGLLQMTSRIQYPPTAYLINKTRRIDTTVCLLTKG